MNGDTCLRSGTVYTGTWRRFALVDQQGKEYIDFAGGIAVNALAMRIRNCVRR